jgi:hypothetical protein
MEDTTGKVLEMVKSDKTEHPIPDRMSVRLSELHDVITRGHRQLGDLRIQYLRKETEILQQIDAAEREFQATTKNVLLSLDVDPKKNYVVDLKAKTVREE